MSPKEQEQDIQTNLCNLRNISEEKQTLKKIYFLNESYYKCVALVTLYHIWIIKNIVE